MEICKQQTLFIEIERYHLAAITTFCHVDDRQFLALWALERAWKSFISIGKDETNTFRGRTTLLKQTCTAKDLKNLTPTL